jgi:hypothetical protein
MIELIQFPFSPYCIPMRRILEYAGEKFKITNVPPQERDLVWKVTKGQYYGVPVIRDGAKVVFDDTDDQQIIAKYLDQKFKLGLFPGSLEGVQSILWRTIDGEIEGATFRLNDIYYRENTRPSDHLQYLRFKERKFGRGCIDHWRAQQKDWQKKNWSAGWCLLSRCWPIRNFCWRTTRYLWISICTGCWRTSCIPAITRCRNRSLICVTGMAV